MELLTIFNDKFERIGVASRDEAHANGLWHETFHCWLVNPHQQTIFLQLRSACKKDYANLFDITAAGHLLATETVEDGIREMEEELGYAQPFTQLKKVGVLPSIMTTAAIKDNEFCHVFIAEVAQVPAFQLQQEEVADIIQLPLPTFYELLEGRPLVTEATGLCTGQLYAVDASSIVPHSPTYFKSLMAYLRAAY